MPDLRVCHVITLLELGGAQENTLYTVSHLRAPFLPSLVCGAGGILDDEARGLGVPLSFVPELARPLRPLRDLAAFRALVRIFRRERPDIVHTHSSKAGILGRLAARRARVPKVVHTIHGYGFNGTQPWPLRRTLIALERLASRVTDRFIAVSRANLDAGVALGLFTPERVSLIRSGIRLSDYAARVVPRDARSKRALGLRRELGLEETAPLVGMVACLKPQKDPLTFVEVAARVVRELPEATFVLAGDGVLRGEVERRASDLHLGARLRLLGWRRDVPRLMTALDVLLHTPRWEGLPRVLPEAIASGVPVVATGVDGITDILADGSTGVVRSPGDVEGLAAGVLRLLRDRDLGRRLAARAREALGEFDIDEMVRAQERLYLSLFATPDEARGEGRPVARINNDARAEDTRRGSSAARVSALATH